MAAISFYGLEEGGGCKERKGQIIQAQRANERARDESASPGADKRADMLQTLHG